MRKEVGFLGLCIIFVLGLVSSATATLVDSIKKASNGAWQLFLSLISNIPFMSFAIVFGIVTIVFNLSLRSLAERQGWMGGAGGAAPAGGDNTTRTMLGIVSVLVGLGAAVAAHLYQMRYGFIIAKMGLGVVLLVLILIIIPIVLWLFRTLHVGWQVGLAIAAIIFLILYFVMVSSTKPGCGANFIDHLGKCLSNIF